VSRTASLAVEEETSIRVVERACLQPSFVISYQCENLFHSGDAVVGSKELVSLRFPLSCVSLSCRFFVCSVPCVLERERKEEGAVVVGDGVHQLHQPTGIELLHFVSLPQKRLDAVRHAIRFSGASVHNIFRRLNDGAELVILSDHDEDTVGEG